MEPADRKRRPGFTAASRYRLASIAVLLMLPLGALAQQDPPDELPPDTRRIVLDLRFTVEDLNRVMETEAEVRIEFAADVLFDFDSAAIKPAAMASLERVGGIIRDEAQGEVRVEG